ncbi:hypothetical protein AB0F88_44165 [Streptosporangium sp. NPDC023963]|uniref:hypothetical protein n=1 Tax=Streptosporangium sp. NPDC023963 TaxID=3155608 RepID=UPI00344771FC
MTRIIRMPSETELPKGPHRDFVEELRRYYRAAGRPPLRQVSRAIEDHTDLKEVTASQETVRRMLRGMVLPTDWNRVYAVFYVFCEMGGIDPESDRWENDNYREVESNGDYLKRLWDAALEETPHPPSIPRPSRPQQVTPDLGRDPWATASPVSDFSDEPPF